MRVHHVASAVRELERQDVARELRLDVGELERIERPHEGLELRPRNGFVLGFGHCIFGTQAPAMQWLPGTQSLSDWQGHAHFPNCVLQR